MTPFKRRICELDARSIAYYRRNPCLAAADLLGVKLTDVQKYILQSTWNTPHAVWCCCRNFGKSFIGGVFLILKAVLYENQAIYIISSVGDQAKETFSKIEELILGIGKTAASIKSLKDILEKETVKSATNKTGFSHNPAGYEVSFYNGSAIMTLNSNPDSARSRRADVVFFDEAAFCSDELIVVCEAFATQNSEFITSTDDDYDPELEPRRCPTQLIYASSQDGMHKLFYKHYKEFAKRMLLGDRDYFVCDMICDTAIKTFMEGKEYRSLLTQDKVDSAMKGNRDKALREYYNQPTTDGGAAQAVKWGAIRRNETFYIPQTHFDPNYKIVLAFDPARTNDNSIIGALRVYDDPAYGTCGDIVNCINLIDMATSGKYKLDSNRQLDAIHETLLQYNGTNPDYEFIDSILIDQGSGGGGVSTYADNLLNDWQDKTGRLHRGIIDANHPIYEGYTKRYPNAINKLRLINPKKLRTQMVEEFIELIELGVLRFPHDYGGSEIIQMVKQAKDGEEEFESYELSAAEVQALAQIDLMKNEITSIQRYTNAENTAVSYALAKDKENRMHDDRFYVAILLAHRLYELRRGKIIEEHKQKANPLEGIMFKQPKISFRR